MTTKTTSKGGAKSVILQVRELKEENAAEYGFDVRAIAAAAQGRQKLHPHRLVTRIRVSTGEVKTLPACSAES